MLPPTTKPEITLLPVTSTDLPALARFESLVFRDDPFSITAFGPGKDTDENLAIRVKGLEKGIVEKGGKRSVNFKAVVRDEGGVEGDGEEEEMIVGWSSWSFVVVGEGGEGEVKVKRDDDAGGEKGVDDEAKSEPNDNEGWGITANLKFCQDVFLVADQWMMDATKGKSYASLSPPPFFSPTPLLPSHPPLHNLTTSELNALLIHPLYQRQGLGTTMLSEGLKEVDRLNLQCVLGASPEGKGLYERFGFEEVGRIELDLESYENGEGLGGCMHGVMWRRARG